MVEQYSVVPASTSRDGVQVCRNGYHATVTVPRRFAAAMRIRGALQGVVLGWLVTNHVGDLAVSEHISRKELKQDKIHDAIEHGAEAFYLHKQITLVVLLVVLAGAVAYGSWTVYHDRQTAAAAVALDTAMKAYNGRIGGTPDPQDPSDVSYADETARSSDALNKFNAVANKYPNTNPGRQARYYAALCLENLERHNQALEDLRKLVSGSDKELASMAQYQMGVIYERTGKPDDAAKILRALADKRSVFVPRPLALLELANVLRQTNPKEATSVYQQIKKEFPDSTISEQADRGLDLLAPKS
jgi:tetratricopeptide (TPR) repeat protein